jgi:hypothetical protein
MQSIPIFTRKISLGFIMGWQGFEGFLLRFVVYFRGLKSLSRILSDTNFWVVAQLFITEL